MALAMHAGPPTQHVVAVALTLHLLSTGSQIKFVLQFAVVVHLPQRGFLVPAASNAASSASLGISASLNSAAIGILSGALGATFCWEFIR